MKILEAEFASLRSLVDAIADRCRYFRAQRAKSFRVTDDDLLRLVRGA